MDSEPDIYNHKDRYDEYTYFNEDINFMTLYLCRHCGSYVGRIDLHDKWHGLLAEEAVTLAEAARLADWNRLIG